MPIGILGMTYFGWRLNLLIILFLQQGVDEAGTLEQLLIVCHLRKWSHSSSQLVTTTVRTFTKLDQYSAV